MKSILLSASALSLSIGLAQADVPVYLGTYGGASFQDDFDGEGYKGSWLHAGHETGYLLGAYLGVPLAPLPGLSAEVDISWRHSSLLGEFYECYSLSELTGSDNTFAATAGLRYTFEPVWGVTPYIVSGLGYGTRRITLQPAPANFAGNGGGADESGFVWQAGAGITFPVSEDIELGVGYRYFSGIEIGRMAGPVFFDASGESHAAIIEAKFSF